MVVLLATTILSCKDLFGIVNRLQQVSGITYQQKIEVLKVLKEHVPSCPVEIKPDGK